MDIPYLGRRIEFENKLFCLLPEKFCDHFKKQILSNRSSYWQILSEMRTIVLFHKLGISPEEVDAKTVKDKNVDFVFKHNGERIYVEVKGLKPENYLAKKSGSFGPGEEDIKRALRRSQDKFFKNSCNIVVLANEETSKTTSFMNSLSKHGNKPLICLRDSGNEKTSALIILGGYYEDQFLKFRISYNPYAQEELTQELKIIFDQKQSHGDIGEK